MPPHNTFAANPDAVAVVGHYRTGTHWLCALMELYFGHPVAPRTTFYPDRPFLALATHDGAGLMGPRHRAIYLYRDPVDTLFSQAHIKGAAWGNDPEQIRQHTGRYRNHLARWLAPGYCAHKAVVRYECMREDFPRVCLLFNQEVDEQRLGQALARVTKEVIVASPPSAGSRDWIARTDIEYAQLRAEFRQRFAKLVWNELASCEWLLPYFEHLPEHK